MDIEYDPTEEEADEVNGLLDYRPMPGTRGKVWVLECPECGVVEHAADGSAESHDRMVRRWPAHMQERHHSDGQMTPEDVEMLIHRP